MNNEIKTSKVGIYSRKSQDAEDKQVLSIPAQLEEAEKLVTLHGISHHRFYSEAKSAKAPGKRKLFTEMVSNLESGKINAIGTWKLDRLARNMEEGGKIIDLLQRGVIKAIITPTKIYWPNENALLMAIEFGSANQFSRDLSVNVKRGQRIKARKGYPHGVAALGFTNDRTEEKGNRKWLVDPIRISLVRDLFDKFLTWTWSAGKLAKYAREVLKFTTPKHKKIGGGLITRSRIYELLKDPIYAGFFFYEDIRYELLDSLPRIITEEQHCRVIRILSAKNIPKIKSHHLTYSGFVRSPEGEFVGQDVKSQLICDCKHKFSYINKDNCPKCGKPIIELDNPKYLEYRYFYNVSRRKQGLEARTVSEDELQEYLINFFKENVQISPALVEWSKKYLHELRDKEIETNRAIASQEKYRVEEAVKRKKKMLQLMADGEVAPEDGNEAINEFNSVISSEVISSRKDGWFEKALDVTDLLTEFVGIMKSDDVQAKREVLSRLGSNLVWDEKKLSILNVKWVNVLVDGLKEAKRINSEFEPKNSLADKDKTEVFASVRPSLLPG